MKNYLLITSLILLTACAGQSSTKIASDDSGKICRYEKTTGSHIGTKICRTPQQMKAEKEAAQQAMKTLVRGDPKSTN